MPRSLEKKTASKKRRGNNEGSIYKRADGRWCAQVVTGYREDGTPIRKYFYSESRGEVARKVSEMTSQVFELGYMNDEKQPQDLTVSDLAQNWLLDYKRFSVASRTFEWYLNLTNTYIVPPLARIKTVEVKTLQIQRILNNLLDSGKAVSTVKSVQFVARQLFNHAVEMKVITDNPATNTKLQKYERKSRQEEMKAIPIELRSRLLEATDGESVIKPIVTTLMFTGLRSGELLALRWCNINFNAMTISVDGAVTVESEYDRDGNRIKYESVVSSTKTVSGFRTIRVSARVMDVLQEWREYLAIWMQAKKKDIVEPESFVFPTQSGDMRTYTSLRSLLRRFLDRNGLGGYGIHAHSFRHTFATILLENNVNPRVVQLYLGHHDVQTTLNIYSTVVSQVFDKTAMRVDEVYDAIYNGTYQPMSPPLQSKLQSEQGIIIEDLC